MAETLSKPPARVYGDPLPVLPSSKSLLKPSLETLAVLGLAKVKQIMEEAVTRKFVHEDSSRIISFCAAVEACVLHGLRRRAAGFLRSNKIAALFMKVGKNFPPAEELSRKVQDLEQLMESARNQIQGLQENVRKLPKLPSLSPLAIKHLWIRTALFEKVLDKIVHYLVENSSKYYEKEALLMDPVDGPILASLLVGPCALEYTKMKTADDFWTDPSADELVQRHRIHSSHLRQDSPTKRPALCIQKRHSSGSMDDRPSLSARDYVESLHQNSRATLFYGKNNVLVQPHLLGLCYDHPPGGDCIPALPPASGQRWDSGVGQPGRDPEAAVSLPQGGAPPAVPLVPGKWAAPSRAAGPSTLVSAGEGQSISQTAQAKPSGFCRVHVFGQGR
ncbi:small G protein signaling modulator 1-like isoform X4 [Felis catus]|uniref:small G protein signaling modulator 1-like isoform X4 n=1 Tax=Felis catus TaxID=9685 RepID=UPI001D1A0222|nr:small G protein signaling modulator 1-like isoform X4 [Felis catus]